MSEARRTDFRSMYDREYIGSFDLPLGAGDLTLTIDKCTGGELTAIGGRKSKKPIVHFKETGVKPLICNKTNGKTIAALYGNFVEAWKGKRITLYRATTRNPDGGEDVECIRVRPKAPTGPAKFDELEEKASAEQIAELMQLCVAKGVDQAAFLAAGELDDWVDLLAKNVAGAKKWIEKKAADQAKAM